MDEDILDGSTVYQVAMYSSDYLKKYRRLFRFCMHRYALEITLILPAGVRDCAHVLSYDADNDVRLT